MPSAIRLVPTVKIPMMITGASTPQGWTSSASRFSLIITPQSAAPGLVAKPRKPTPATMPIEYVSRSPASASSGAFMFGSTSARITRSRLSPSASAAVMKSRETMPSATPRASRATRGACEKPTSSTIIHQVGWSTAVSTSSASRICGNASATSFSRMIASSSQPPA